VEFTPEVQGTAPEKVPPPGKFEFPKEPAAPKTGANVGQGNEQPPKEQAPPEVQAPKEQAPPEVQPQEQESAGVREVKPGTLKEGEKVYSVPLKPITGGGTAGASPAAGSTGTGETAVPAEQLPTTLPSAPSPAALPSGPLPGAGEMVLVPEGYFLMGTGGNSSAGDADELPQTQVFLPAYYIDKYPVSNRQFMEFVLRAGYKAEGKWQEYFSEGTADLPARMVSWNDAAAYAKWAGKRLPTEAEWEKAARGADGRTYPWGEEWSSTILPRGDLVYDLLSATQTASPYGVMGMCGVLWQWTASYYAPYPFNPDATGTDRVLRGGCFSNGHNVIRCANRYNEGPNVALNTFSFRCVKDAK
jgi:formylglycine-generating enzyme required for sulfatase activity